MSKSGSQLAAPAVVAVSMLPLGLVQAPGRPRYPPQHPPFPPPATIGSVIVTTTPWQVFSELDS